MQIKPYQAESFINNIANNKEIFAALIYGPESGLVSIRSKKIANLIVSNLKDPFLVTQLSEGRIDEDKGIIADEFASMSMLGGRKLIMVDGKNKITESLKMIFDKPKKSEDFEPAGDNFILITAGDLDAKSSLRKFAQNNPYIVSIACYEDDDSTIQNIIREKFKEQGCTFDNDVILMILNKFGKNRQVILNEIEKLVLFMGDEKHINSEIAQKNIADIAEISSFQLIAEFANKNPEKVNFFLEKLFAEKTSPIAIIRMLSTYLNKLLLVKSNVENGGSMDLEMKIQNIFFKQQDSFKKHLRMWGNNSLNNLLIKLQELEVKCKNSNFDSETLLKSFLNFSLLKKNSKKTN
ncbi:MAG: DNA polymerase-3 subunit delta [Lentimonas sp.]|jgi:DNA polymerase-3 subunit delta